MSVVGRFLEHSRLYYFKNGGADEYFIASADAMKRNLEARVEVLCPVESPELTKELRAIFDIHCSDQCSVWDMQPDGSYIQRMPDAVSSLCGSHHLMIERAARRLRESLKQKKKARLHP
jgi:polyphosphate kinase